MAQPPTPPAEDWLDLFDHLVRVDVGNSQQPWRLPMGFKFLPNGRCLVANYLAPKVLFGCVPDDLPQDAVIDGVDVYGTHPEALPFHPYNLGDFGKVWGHFFTTWPAEAATSGGVDDDVRNAQCGCWCRYGSEKAYASEDGDVVAFRTRFAFYDWQDDGKLTPWRMKEFRVNEGAAAFRGVAFHPIAKDLVALKVYNEEEVLDVPWEYSPADYHEDID